MKKILAILLLSVAPAHAQYFSAAPVTLTDGTTAHAADVMTDLNKIISDGNTAYATLSAAITALTPGAAIQTGMIINYNGSGCPTGYGLFSALSGKFARSWNNGGTYDVGRAIATSQTSMLQNHTHGSGTSGLTSMNYGSNGTSGGAITTVTSWGSYNFSWGTSGSGTESYPAYYVLPYCSRN